MVYHHVKVHHLTPTQKHNLLKGKAVRMHLGSHHTIPMREDQVKKLHRNHAKGMASTISLDDGALSHLHGTGFFDSMKKAFQSPVAKQISQALRPVATNMARGALTSMGPIGQALGNATIDVLDQQAQQHGYGIKKRGRPSKKHYVHHDVRLVEPVARGRKLRSVKGKGMFGDILKAGSKALRPVATDFLKSKLADRGGILGAVGNAGLDLANQLAEKHGYGVKKRRGRPSKKGGALIAAGY